MTKPQFFELNFLSHTIAASNRIILFQLKTPALKEAGFMTRTIDSFTIFARLRSIFSTP